MSRAAYMRAYRAKKREGVGVHIPIPKDFTGTEAEVLAVGAQRILALEEEIRQLKRELAARPILGTFEKRPAVQLDDKYLACRPVPKPSRK